MHHDRQQAFYPWGGVVPGVGFTTSNNTVKFTGQYRDSESQLDYFGTGGPSFSLRLGCPHDNVGCPILAGSPARAIFARWGDEQGWDSMSCPVYLRS
jgi:hypothetical protein